MTSFKDLLSRTVPRQPIAHVPMLILEEDNAQFSIGKDFRMLGIDEEGFLDMKGTGVIFFDCPVYALSSHQKKVWDSSSQSISAIVMRDADDATVSLMIRGGKESDLSLRSQLSLFAVGASEATAIRSYQEDMVSAVLGLSRQQLDLVTSVRGLGESRDDLFTIILEGLQQALAPKAIEPTEGKDKPPVVKGKKANPLESETLTPS